MLSRSVAAASGTRQDHLGKGWPLWEGTGPFEMRQSDHLAKKVAFEQKSEEEREQLVVAVCR